MADLDMSDVERDGEAAAATSPAITERVSVKEVLEEIAAYLPDVSGQYQQAICATESVGQFTVIVNTHSGQRFQLQVVELSPAT